MSEPSGEARKSSRGAPHRLFAAASVISLLLCVATGVFWTRSFYRMDELQLIRRDDTSWWLCTHRNGAAIAYCKNIGLANSILPREFRPRLGWSMQSHSIDETITISVPDADSPHNENGPADNRLFSQTIVTIFYHWSPPPHYHGGFGWDRTNYTSFGVACESRQWIAPFWFILTITAVLPAWRLLTWAQDRRSRRRARAGLCIVCGYDLQATPLRCPECGRATGAT